MTKEKRFEAIHTEGSGIEEIGMRSIMLDKETGVQYLIVRHIEGISITPLLDEDGKPLVKN